MAEIIEKPTFLFDLYGTLADILTDEDSAKFWLEIAALLGTDDAAGVQKKYRALCADAASAMPQDAEIDLIPVFARLLAEYGKSGAAAFARRFRALSAVRLRLFPWTLPLLGGLREAGAKIYLLSNAQACFTRDELEMLGLSHRFNGILLSSEAGWKKPSPQFFGIAMQRFSLSPANCIYVGNDLRDDVGGAREAGMKSVYIETEQSGRYCGLPPADFTATPSTIVPLLLGLAGTKRG